MMKMFAVITAAAVVVSAGTAFSADLSEPVPASFEERVASNFDWTGGYVGVNVGGGFGKFKHPFDITGGVPAATLLNGSLDITSGGFLGGAQAGYNWQNGGFVLGAEVDFQGSAVKAEDSLSLNIGGPGGIDINGDAGTKVQWFGTVRARVGATPADRLLVYGTAGLAYGKVKSYIDGNITAGGAPVAAINESKSDTKVGWTAGAGAEYAFTNNWTIKSEYLYTDLGKTTLINANVGGFNARLRNDVSFHTFRVGLNYKF